MMLQEGGVKIWRPRQVRPCGVVSRGKRANVVCQVYVGSGNRDYVPIEKRPVVRGLKVEPLPVPHSG